MTFGKGRVGFQNPSEIIANIVDIIGAKGKLLVYSPGRGAGNLIASIAAQAGTDAGNAYLQGVTEYSNYIPNFVAMRQSGAGLDWSISVGSEAGPWTGLMSQTLVFIGSIASPALAIYPSFGLVTALDGTGTFIEAWIGPSGDTSGVTDFDLITAIYGAAVSLNVRLLVHYQPADYYWNSGVSIPNFCGLKGAFPVQSDTSSNYGIGSLALSGTVIHAAGAFTSVTPPTQLLACENLTNTSQFGGQYIADFSMEGNVTKAGTGVVGCLLYGGVGAGVMENISIHRFDGPNLRIQTDVASGKVPDQWRITRNVFSASRSSHGIQADNIPDSIFAYNLSHNNALNGGDFSGSVNTSFGLNRWENNAQNGVAFHGQVGAGEDTWINGDSSQLNQLSGFLFDAAAHANQGQYLLTGCRSNADGQVGGAGITAGFYDNGCKSAVICQGCTTIVNVTGPNYGAYVGSVAFGMALIGRRMFGNIANTHDDLTNVHALSDQVPIPF